MDTRNLKAVLCDIGGVLYVGDRPVEGAIEAVAALRSRYHIRFLTNTTQKTGTQVVEKLRAMGFAVEAHEVLTALDVTKRYLKERDAGAELLLTDDAIAFFDDLRDLTKRFVVVGDAQQNFTYERMNRAFRLLQDGAKLLAAAKNRYFKDADGKLSMDAGGFVAALEYAAGCRAEIIGKPSAAFYTQACASMGVSPAETVMIGDDIESDVGGAQAAGLRAILVETGKFTPHDLERGIVPDAVAPSIASLPI